MATTRRGCRRRGPHRAGPARTTRRRRLLPRCIAPPTDVDGCYAGVCVNLTTCASATLLIQISRGADGAWTGALRVGPGLHGSGSITGSVTGRRIWLVSSNPDFPMSWCGVRVGRRIVGIYLVAVADPPSRVQFGTWAVTRS